MLQSFPSLCQIQPTNHRLGSSEGDKKGEKEVETVSDLGRCINPSCRQAFWCFRGINPACCGVLSGDVGEEGCKPALFISLWRGAE